MCLSIKDLATYRCQALPHGDRCFRYHIVPVNDMNFGSILVNSKKVRTFIIENKGERFEFKYTITKLVKDTVRTTEEKKGRG